MGVTVPALGRVPVPVPLPVPVPVPRPVPGPVIVPVRVTGRCQGCGACLLTCPERAIRPRSEWAARGIGPLDVHDDLCTGCGDCLEVCPVDAIEEAASPTPGPPGRPDDRRPSRPAHAARGGGPMTVAAAPAESPTSAP